MKRIPFYALFVSVFFLGIPFFAQEFDPWGAEIRDLETFSETPDQMVPVQETEEPLVREEIEFTDSQPGVFPAENVQSEEVPPETVQEEPAKQKFVFKYKKDDAYRILSVVNEDIYVNNIFNHSAEILNRISVKVSEAEEDSGIHEATFMTSERAVGKNGGTFSYAEDYLSIFKRDSQGKYEISDEYFMPVVRDVPVFPDREIAAGEKWTAEGHEAHDLRRTFSVEKPYKIPFTAQYEYLGIETGENGKIFHKFDVQYTMGYSVDIDPYSYRAVDVPVETQGYSHQIIYWDTERGYIDHYSESFRIVIGTSRGNILRFEGTAHAEVTEFERTADVENIASVIEKIEDLGIEDVTVKESDKGLTLSIENIQFKPDSDILLESEKIKLDKIAVILNEYPENDLLVTGHTALRGTKKERQLLSEERARSVADYLVQKNVRDKYHIFTKGMGAEVPVADNSTEEGRSKNRRVEITIMDK